MIPLLEQHRGEIEALCRAYQVKRLEVFGSAATGEFDPARSDVDLLVEYEPGADLGPWLSRYVELKEAFEALFGRKVDLVMSKAPRLPYFIEELNRTRKLFYAA